MWTCMRAWSFSAEQLDMPDGIAAKDTAVAVAGHGIASTTNRGRLQKIIAPQQDDQV